MCILYRYTDLYMEDYYVAAFLFFILIPDKILFFNKLSFLNKKSY